jgi:hypothetical protein
MAKRKPTKAEREEAAAFSARVFENARRTRELAERAYAKLSPAERAHVEELAPSARRGR